MLRTSCIFSSYVIPFPRAYPAPGVLFLWGNCIAEQRAFMQRTFLHGFEGPTLLCQLSQREERDVCFEGTRCEEDCPNHRTKMEISRSLKYYGLHLPRAVLHRGQYESNLSEPIKSQLVFLGLSEPRELVAQENRI